MPTNGSSSTSRTARRSQPCYEKNKKEGPGVSCKQADSGPFCYAFDAVLRTISQKNGAADSQNYGGRRDFVLIVPIVPVIGVSPLTNSAKIYTRPRAGQQLECGQRSDRPLGDCDRTSKMSKDDQKIIYNYITCKCSGFVQN